MCGWDAATRRPCAQRYARSKSKEVSERSNETNFCGLFLWLSHASFFLFWWAEILGFWYKFSILVFVVNDGGGTVPAGFSPD